MESLKKYNDWQNVLDYAHEEGYQEAVLKYEELLQKITKRAEEEHKKLIETAKWLLSLGMSIDTISEKTGLTKEEIEKL
jgi:dihydroneopterin aldolase